MINRKKPRKKFLVVSTLLIFTFSLFSNTQPAIADPLPRKILSGWIPYWNMKEAIPAIVANGDLIKEVMPFWYSLKSPSKIADDYTSANPSVPMAIPLATLRDSGFTIIPTITDETLNADGTKPLALAKMLADPATRAQIVKLISDLAFSKNINGIDNFDGIDLDFETFAFVDPSSSWPSTRVNWVSFIQELSNTLHAKGKLLSLTTPYLLDPATGKKGYYVYDWASTGPMIDRLRIMTYDYSTTNPGPIGPIDWVERTVSYAVSVVPASKVYVGVAGYGKDWITKVEGTCPSQYASAIKTNAKAAAVIMKDMPGLATKNGATPTYSEVNAEVTFTYQKAYTVKSDAGVVTTCTATHTVWYQDARSYSVRAQLVAKYHLAGLAAWTLGWEDLAASEAVRTVGRAIAPDQVVSTLTFDTNEIAYGIPVNLKGVFQLQDKQPISGLPVHLEIRTVGEASWREILQTATGPDGTVIAPLTLGNSTFVRLRSDASWERLGSQSSELQVFVKGKLSVNAPTSSPVGSQILIHGTVQPKRTGVEISLERFVSGAWKPSGAKTQTDISGGYSLSVTETTRTPARYRVIMGNDEKIAGQVGAVFTIVIY